MVTQKFGDLLCAVLPHLVGDDPPNSFSPSPCSELVGHQPILNQLDRQLSLQFELVQLCQVELLKQSEFCGREISMLTAWL